MSVYVGIVTRCINNFNAVAQINTDCLGKIKETIGVVVRMSILDTKG